MLYENMIINDTYQVVEEIGSGGMGVVYLAYHLHLLKYVVLKKIKNPYANISLLRNEVDILKTLHHPYLPQVYDFIEYEGNLYTVIDYIDGYDLNYYINNNWQFTESQLIKWLKQLCEVLSYLHSRNPQILHTDIKPGNIIITTGGDICLIDFGISLYNTDVIKGLSEYYSSPEQYNNFYYLQYGEGTYCQLDERTDIYSLGATFYHLMTGIRPDVKNNEQISISQYSLPYSEALVSIMEKSMQYDINSRFRDADAMLHAIDNIRKQDSRYKKYILIQIVSSVIAAVLIVSGVLLIVGGYQQKAKNDFENEYNTFLQQADSGDSSKAAQLGMHILNNGEYSAVIGTDQRADILQKIADCFYINEDYYNAAHYYELELNYNKSELVSRDLILSLIKEGSSDKAQKYIDETKSRYPDSAVLAVIEAQLCYVNGDYAQSAEIVVQNESKLSSDAENRYAAYIIKGDSYTALKMYSEAVEAYNEAKTAKETPAVLRKLCNTYLQLAAKSGDDSYKNSAMECLGSISERYSLNLEDTLNYTQVVLSTGKAEDYEKCKKNLLDLSERYNDCRIYILLAELADATADINAGKYCLKAHELFKNGSENERAYVSSESLASIKELYKKYCGPDW